MLEFLLIDFKIIDKYFYLLFHYFSIDFKKIIFKCFKNSLLIVLMLIHSFLKSKKRYNKLLFHQISQNYLQLI